MATTLEELVTVWRVKTRDEALNKMKVSIESIKSSMIRLGVIAAGAGASLGAVALPVKTSRVTLICSC